AAADDAAIGAGAPAVGLAVFGLHAADEDERAAFGAGIQHGKLRDVEPGPGPGHVADRPGLRVRLNGKPASGRRFRVLARRPPALGATPWIEAAPSRSRSLARSRSRPRDPRPGPPRPKRSSRRRSC